jgi:protoporphyrinogen oxidase
MEAPQTPYVVIMGAGPAGLTAAYQLHKANVCSTLIEKDGVVGGIARTVSYKGYLFDIGGHRFFTKSQAVDRMWREILVEADFLRRNRLSRIYYNKRFFYYPLRVANTLAGLGLWNSLCILASYFEARLRPCRPERTFEDWVSNRFGRRLYETFFKTYTEKVWGIPCSQITADWAAQRIKGLSLLTALQNAMIGQKSNDKSKAIRTLIDSFHYPRKGPGMMWEAVAGIVTSAGHKLNLHTEVEKIFWSADSVTGVLARRDGQTEPIFGTHFLSTLPIRELIQKLDPPPPLHVLEAANRLHYRDFVTVALIINRRDLFPDNWIYIHEPAVKVGRIQNFKNWSPDMVADPLKTCLGLEYFCFEGDGLWTASDEELVSLARRELVLLKLAREEDVEDGTVVRMRKAYPVYDSTFRQALSTIRTFLDPLANLQLIGRNGMHKYNNQDHSMLTAMMAARNILGCRHNLWEVNADQEYHEELTAGTLDVEDDFAVIDATQPAVPERFQPDQKDSP